MNSNYPVLVADQFTETVANEVIRRIMNDSNLTEKQAERLFLSRMQIININEPTIIEDGIKKKRYRSLYHRLDAACLASSRQEALNFFRKLLGCRQLPKDFVLKTF